MSVIEYFGDYQVPPVEDDDTYDLLSEKYTKNATDFKWQEAPFGYRLGQRRESFRDYYKRLRGYHTGLYNGWWEDAARHHLLQKQYLFQMISSQLELTPEQRRRAKRLLKSEAMDMRRYNYPNVPVTEAVIIAICAYVCHQDGRKCHPNVNDSDYIFENLLNQLGIKHANYAKIYGRLEHYVRRVKTPEDRPKDGEFHSSTDAGSPWRWGRGI